MHTGLHNVYSGTAVGLAKRQARHVRLRGGVEATRSFYHRVTAAAMAVLLLAAAPASAQSPTPEPATGMSRWAFWLAESGQIADVITTEIGLAQGLRESNSMMAKRGIRIPLKLALPLVAKLVTNKAPRRVANTYGVVIGATGAGLASWNVRVIARWGK